MATSVTKGGTQKLAKPTFSEHTDMTIHRKAIEEHFLMVPLVFRFNHFWEENAFSEFFSKTSDPRVNHLKTEVYFCR
jgi:hypothetical protein